MQTFLPYESFEKSASVLDNSRIGKQVVEAVQIYNRLRKGSGGWGSHPAVLQWKGYEGALLLYIRIMANESRRRGFVSEYSKTVPDPPLNILLPKWFTRNEVFSSHRSKLLFKGRVDAVYAAIKKHFKVKSMDEVFWLCYRILVKNKRHIKKNQVTMPILIELENFAKNESIAIGPNFYSQYGWTESDTQGYIWPVTKK